MSNKKPKQRDDNPDQKMICSDRLCHVLLRMQSIESKMDEIIRQLRKLNEPDPL